MRKLMTANKAQLANSFEASEDAKARMEEIQSRIRHILEAGAQAQTWAEKNDYAGDLNTISKMITEPERKIKSELKDHCRESEIKGVEGSRYNSSIRSTTVWDIKVSKLLKWLVLNGKMEDTAVVDGKKVPILEVLLSALTEKIKYYLGVEVLSKIGVQRKIEVHSIGFKEKV